MAKADRFRYHRGMSQAQAIKDALTAARNQRDLSQARLDDLEAGRVEIFRHRGSERENMTPTEIEELRHRIADNDRYIAAYEALDA